MTESLQRVRQLTPHRLRRLLGFIWRGVSYVLVRPESERLFTILTEPSLESSAYVSRALRDLEAAVRSLQESRIESPTVALLELAYVVTGLAGLPIGASILLMGGDSGLLAATLKALGHEPAVTIGPPESGSFDAVIALRLTDRTSLRKLRPSVRRPGLLLMSSPNLTGNDLVEAGWKPNEIRRGRLRGSEGWRLEAESAQLEGGPSIVLATSVAE